MIQNTWAKGGAILSLCLAQGAFAQSAEGSGVMYRCPGNDYNNTISAKEAKDRGCKTIEGAPITVIQTTRPKAAAPSGGASPAASGPASARNAGVARGGAEIVVFVDAGSGPPGAIAIEPVVAAPRTG